MHFVSLGVILLFFEHYETILQTTDNLMSFFIFFSYIFFDAGF